jgi:hypothetical protein
MSGLLLIGDLFMGHILHALEVVRLALTPGAAIGLASVLGYLSLVRLLRWQRFNAVHRQYASRYNARTKRWDITPQEAQKIMQVSNSYDMPKLLNSALSFALFKTYAIVSSFSVSTFVGARSDALSLRATRHAFGPNLGTFKASKL